MWSANRNGECSGRKRHAASALQIFNTWRSDARGTKVSAMDGAESAIESRRNEVG
jgi:hypothetical protein